MRAAGPLSLQSLALPVEKSQGLQSGLAGAGGTSAWPALVTLMWLPTVFTLGLANPHQALASAAQPIPAVISPGSTARLGAGSEGSSSITCDRKGLLGSFQEERRGLNPSCARCSVFHGRLEAHPRTPTPVPTFQAQQQQQPGTFLN